jgi:hypothetical protein
MGLVEFKQKKRNFEAKWRKNCCAIKILKKLNIAISPNLMIQIALITSVFTSQILRKF